MKFKNFKIFGRPRHLCLMYKLGTIIKLILILKTNIMIVFLTEKCLGPKDEHQWQNSLNSD